MRAGEPAAATEHFEQGIRLTASPDARVRAARGQAMALFALGRRDEAFVMRERAMEHMPDDEPELALVLEAEYLAGACFDRTRRGWARERVDHYRGTLTGETAGQRVILATQAHLDSFFGDQPADVVADTAERALASDKLLEDTNGGESPAFFFAINALVVADRVDAVRRALDQAVERARRRGSAPGFAFASGWRCWLLSREGALADAEADGRSCAELSLSQGWIVVVPLVLGYLIDVLLDRGDVADAARFLERSGMADRMDEQDLAFHPLVHARARLRAAQGDLGGARDDLAGLVRHRARWNTYPTLVPSVLVAPELVTAERDEARALADRMLREARGWGTPRAIGMALRAAGLLENGARGLELLEEAAEVLATSPARVEYARALADLGAALRRANRRAAARDPLRRALDIADACGARPLAERTRQELRAAGGRPRRPRISGVEALTASERRIATMAARGLSNPEIAQALFVTKKTVEAHLGSAYRKLGIHSRSDLPRVLGSE
jgi:DNA-binding NarL/FixJ family response regulator